MQQILSPGCDARRRITHASSVISLVRLTRKFRNFKSGKYEQVVLQIVYHKKSIYYCFTIMFIIEKDYYKIYIYNGLHNYRQTPENRISWIEIHTGDGHNCTHKQRPDPESNEEWKFMCKSEMVAMAGGNRTKVNRLCCGSCQIQDVSVGVGVRDQKLFCFC